ncbi:MAG: site-specific integrase [Rhodospirillaceae bacterium]|jgi:integrase|nr:site-specific integrase [Rhodospirillaceae bacterium]MBT5245161.1 site-specific integrase [Rhodospirillaceae bacterium]MBT6241995.1 site-specific integrase [Rhodospirillaceae bacterium]
MATIMKRGPYQWQAKVRRRGYPSQAKTFETKREAEAWVSVIESEMTRSVFVDRSRAERETLNQVIQNYIDNIAPDHKGGDSEILRLKKFKRDQSKLCQHAMATLKIEDFEAYRDRRLKVEKKAPATVKRELALLHSVIESARRRLGLIENPISDVRRPRVQNNRIMRFQDGEEEALMTALDGCRNSWVKPAVILALETAMRRGELLDLRWENINLKDRTAHLPDTKNGESRDVPLSPIALQTLKDLPRSLKGYVFPTSAEGIKSAYERARKRADMEHFNFHDLRHEAISRLFERGWNVMEVAAVSGHKDLQSLKRYTNLKARDLAQKMSRP